MHSTDNVDTLITVSTDNCPGSAAAPPTKSGAIAQRQHAFLSAAPYTLTSDELLLAIERERKGPVKREDFFATPKARLRASPLVKKDGYGFHHDGNGKVALIPMESSEYAQLLADSTVTKCPGMRSWRK